MAFFLVMCPFFNPSHLHAQYLFCYLIRGAEQVFMAGMFHRCIQTISFSFFLFFFLLGMVPGIVYGWWFSFYLPWRQPWQLSK